MTTYTIPTRTKESIDNYVKYGLPPGGFVYAVLSNDLMEAVGRADNINLKHFHSIASYIYNEIPKEAHGSEETVKNWLSKDWEKYRTECKDCNHVGVLGDGHIHNIPGEEK